MLGLPDSEPGRVSLSVSLNAGSIPEWHGVPPNREQADQALREMGTSLDAWTARLERCTKPEVAPGPGPGV